MNGWAARQLDAPQRDVAIALGIVLSDEMTCDETTWAPLHCTGMQRRHHFLASAESRAGLALPLYARTRTISTAFARIAAGMQIAVVQTCHAHSVNVPRSTSLDRHCRSISVDHRQFQRSSACTAHACLDSQSPEIFFDRFCGPACGARRKRTTLNSTRNEISRRESHEDRMEPALLAATDLQHFELMWIFLATEQIS